MIEIELILTTNAASARNCSKRLEISSFFFSISGVVTLRFDCTLEFMLLRSIIGVNDVNEVLDTGRDRRESTKKMSPLSR